MMCGVLDARRLICCSLRSNHNGPRRTDAARVIYDQWSDCFGKLVGNFDTPKLDFPVSHWPLNPRI